VTRPRTILSVIGGVLLVAAIAFGARFWSSWNKPLGVSLGLPTSTATQTRPAAPTATLRPGVTPTLTPILTATPTALCGGPAVMTILAIGSDTRANDYLYGLSDVMRVVRVDFVTPKITVLDLPRDLWVEIPDIAANYGIDQGKLNQAYFYGNPGMGYYTGPGEGPGLLARTLQKNFGIAVDHYGAVNMQTFVKVVDAVGGIDVYLPGDVDGRPVDSHTVDLGYFYAGQQHLNGDAALRLARVRKKYTVFKRADNQNIVLCALKDKILTRSVLPKVPQIAESFFGSVQTDLSPAQISQLACVLPKVASENLMFANIPQELYKPSTILDPYDIKNGQPQRTFVWDIDRTVMQDYIDRFLAGTWPQPSADSGPTCPPPVKP